MENPAEPMSLVKMQDRVIRSVGSALIVQFEKARQKGCRKNGQHNTKNRQADAASCNTDSGDCNSRNDRQKRQIAAPASREHWHALEKSVDPAPRRLRINALLALITYLGGIRHVPTLMS
jgi:hypothetical protein